MSLFFNMLSMLSLLFFQGAGVFEFHGCSDFGAQENKVSHYVHYFPIYLL